MSDSRVKELSVKYELKERGGVIYRCSNGEYVLLRGNTTRVLK